MMLVKPFPEQIDKEKIDEIKLDIKKIFLPVFYNTEKKLDVSTAHQGVATDGEFIFTTDNPTLYKYSMDGTELETFSHGISGYKNEDFCVVENIVYVPLTNHPDTNPRKGKIQKFDADDLSLIETIDLNENIHPAAMAFKDGTFWMTVTEDDSIYVYDKDFNLKKVYTFPVIGEQATGDIGPGYSGLEWMGAFLFGNKHEGTTRFLDVAFYDHLKDEFTAVIGLDHVSSGTTQGMTWDVKNNKIYWAARGHDREVWQSDIKGGLDWLS